MDSQNKILDDQGGEFENSLMAEIKDHMCNGNAEHFKPTILPDTAIT